MKTALPFAALILIGLGVFAITPISADPPTDGPPGQGDCQHGNSGKPCREDPQPDHGKDCIHGNQDHCLPTATPTATATSTATPTATATNTPTATATTEPTSTPTPPPGLLTVPAPSIIVVVPPPTVVVQQVASAQVQPASTQQLPSALPRSGSGGYLEAAQ